MPFITRRATPSTALADDRPPLIVISHGGPTSQTKAVLDLQVQFWTSRGFAVVDVNYGGSTGFGREYRQRLNWHWGIVDVDDSINAARFLVEAGKGGSRPPRSFGAAAPAATPRWQR